MPVRDRLVAARRFVGVRPLLVATVIPASIAALGACATTPTDEVNHTGSTITVVAAENFWGSLVGQLGAGHVSVHSVIDSPAADPHEYEPTAADGRMIARARMVVVNGIGYDTWASKLVSANPSPDRVVLTVGDIVDAPKGGNPHRWYNPTDVRAVIDRVTAALKQLDPADAAFFDRQRRTVLDTNLKRYFDLIAEIRSRYAGTPVGASESIFAMLAPALGLDLITPPAFLAAISQGTEPSARDKVTIDAQITDRRILVYVLNSQNATPDVQAQVDAARSHRIPVTTITETLTPADASFQDWQSAQLTALQQALARATGR